MTGKWLDACLLGIAITIGGAGMPLRAEIVYVDSQEGNDDWSGRPEQPIRTLAKAAQIVNNSGDPGPTTVRLAPGAYSIAETVTFENSRAYAADKRFVIEAVVLPDANDWTPAAMPVVISTVQGQGPQTEQHAIAFKIEVSHTTVRGVKFLGNPRPNTWGYSIFRMRRDLADLVVNQCLFVGDEEALPYSIPICANGQGLVVDHCVFYKCDIPAIFWDAEGGSSRGNAMRYCIVDGADIAAVWTCQTADDFEFHHNIVTRSQYLWMRAPANRTTYTVRDCVITNNKYDSGYGTAARISGPTGPEVTFRQENVVREGTVRLVRPVVTPEALGTVRSRDYLHVAPGAPGYTLGAGLFTNTARQTEASACGARAMINGASIYYERHGRGNPILLLHGGFSHIGHQAGLIDLLAQQYEVIAVDTRGHGRSTLGDRPMTYPLLADDMARLLDELGVGPVTIVGHSDGGVIGYILATKHPKKVRALVANGANFRKAGRGGMTPQMNEWIKTITPEMVEGWGDLRQSYEKLNPEADWNRFVAKVKELWQSETDLAEEDLRAIRCPVLISHGDSDTFVSLADIVWMYEQLPDADLYVAPAGEHGHHTDQIEAFGPILLRFLNRVHEQKKGVQS
ncbi:MAG: alpha/beta fold hydrolase [Phycisphaerales bacterium]